ARRVELGAEPPGELRTIDPDHPRVGGGADRAHRASLSRLVRPRDGPPCPDRVAAVGRTPEARPPRSGVCRVPWGAPGGAPRARAGSHPGVLPRAPVAAGGPAAG